MICSSSLLLLQKDNQLLPRLSSQNHYVPMCSAASAVLVAFSAYFCDVWLAFSDDEDIALSAFGTFRSGMELWLIMCTVPVYIIGWVCVWCGAIVYSDRLVVLFTPLSCFLMIVGSSAVARVLGINTLLFGAWLMTKKLPLKREVK